MHEILEHIPYRDIHLTRRTKVGYIVYTIEMPEALHQTEAHLIAIAHKIDEAHLPMRPSASTRYFTLEKGDPEESPHFCEWDNQGNHLNHGQPVPLNSEAFIETVFSTLEGRS